jgi:NmrA-like family
VHENYAYEADFGAGCRRWPGGAVADALLARRAAVRAMVRRPDERSARRLIDAGVEVAAGSFDDPAALGGAMEASPLRLCSRPHSKPESAMGVAPVAAEFVARDRIDQPDAFVTALRGLREAGPPRHLLNRDVADVLLGQVDAHGDTLPNLKRFKKSIAMLTYTGRCSGRRFSIPVAYRSSGDDVVISVNMFTRPSRLLGLFYQRRAHGITLEPRRRSPLALVNWS